MFYLHFDTVCFFTLLEQNRVMPAIVRMDISIQTLLEKRCQIDCEQTKNVVVFDCIIDNEVVHM